MFFIKLLSSFFDDRTVAVNLANNITEILTLRKVHFAIIMYET